jgi:hypothetical protein
MSSFSLTQIKLLLLASSGGELIPKEIRPIGNVQVPVKVNNGIMRVLT